MSELLMVRQWPRDIMQVQKSVLVFGFCSQGGDCVSDQQKMHKCRSSQWCVSSLEISRSTFSSETVVRYLFCSQRRVCTHFTVWLHDRRAMSHTRPQSADTKNSHHCQVRAFATPRQANTPPRWPVLFFKMKDVYF